MTARRGDNLEFSGISLSPGLAMGRAFVYKDVLENNLCSYSIATTQVENEYGRIEIAIDHVLGDLRESADRVENELESALAEIFRTHAQMLRDGALCQEIRMELEQELVNAERALQRVFLRWEKRFHGMENQLFQQRGDDVADLGRRLLRALLGVHKHGLEEMPAKSILVAQRLYPSDTVHLCRHPAAALVVEFGGPGSHCALLARAMGIPGVSQIDKLLKYVGRRQLLLVDGNNGRVNINPSTERISGFRSELDRHLQVNAQAMQHCQDPAITTDGVRIAVMANISNRQDAELARRNGADGVGLFRVEMLFLARTMLPTEDELLQEMRLLLAPIRGKPLAVRLLDIGGDKILPYLQMPGEDNPFLGRRGVRLLLHYRELLNLQLRTFLRLAQEHDLEILVPMVTVADDLAQVRSALQQQARHLQLTTLPPLAAMIETPAAALSTGEISRYAESLSIGTNDLTQYTMAAGRENPLVCKYFRDTHPAVLRLVRIAVADAGQMPIALCGELAGRCEAIAELLQIGITTLSVAPPLIPAVKEAVRTSAATVPIN